MLKSIINRFEEIFVITALGIMAIVLVMQVVCRYIFNSPLIWSEEFVRYIFVWITFVGAGYGAKKHLHIEMEALFNVFPKVAQKVIQILVNCISIFFYAYIIPDSIRFTASQHEIASTAMGIPMSFLFAAVPVGCSLLVIRLIIETVKIVTDRVAEREKVFVE